MTVAAHITRVRVRIQSHQVFLDITRGNHTHTEEAQHSGQLNYMLDRARQVAHGAGLDHFVNEFGDKVWLAPTPAEEPPKADRYPARSRLQREIARLDVLRQGISAQLTEIDDAKEALGEILNATVKLYQFGEEEAEVYLNELTDKYIGRLIDKKLLDGEA